MTIAGVLPYIELVLSVALIICVLLQQTGASLGGANEANSVIAKAAMKAARVSQRNTAGWPRKDAQVITKRPFTPS